MPDPGRQGSPAAPSLGARVFETRTTTITAVLLYYDGLLKLMRDGGFSYDVIHHALHAFGSRALGFAQEMFDPGDGPGRDETGAELAAWPTRSPPRRHVHGGGAR